jgi:Ala-tRNA(Pro) deacylase
MAVVARLREYLDGHAIKYSVISHSRAYAAQELAALTHVRGKEFAKTVVVKVGDQFVAAVVPAHHQVVLEELSRVLGADARLATEEELNALFSGCEVGAMPPFGNLYRVPVWVAEPLTRDEEIVFNAGTHTDAIRMRYSDFDRLVKPRVAAISQLGLYPPRVEPIE